MKTLLNLKTKTPLTTREFHLKNTLLNGQCFNWERDLSDNEDGKLPHFVGVY